MFHLLTRFIISGLEESIKRICNESADVSDVLQWNCIRRLRFSFNVTRLCLLEQRSEGKGADPDHGVPMRGGPQEDQTRVQGPSREVSVQDHRCTFL